MTFSTQNLVGNRVLVTGTDVFGESGKQVLDGTQWAELAANKRYDAAQQDFNATVLEFFSEITEAAEAAAKAGAPAEVDSLTYVTLEEGVEAVAGKAERRIPLTEDSMILRLVEQDASTGRLIWVDGSLEILEQAITPAGGTSVHAADAAL